MYFVLTSSHCVAAIRKGPKWALKASENVFIHQTYPEPHYLQAIWNKLIKTQPKVKGKTLADNTMKLGSNYGILLIVCRCLRQSTTENMKQE